jgi:hypothetical protein
MKGGDFLIGGAVVIVTFLPAKNFEPEQVRLCLFHVHQLQSLPPKMKEISKKVDKIITFFLFFCISHSLCGGNVLILYPL